MARLWGFPISDQIRAGCINTEPHQTTVKTDRGSGRIHILGVGVMKTAKGNVKATISENSGRRQKVGYNIYK
jgi:hypothetical protein